MRTPVPDLLRRTILGLSTTVLPEVSSPYAQSQLRYAFAVLDTVAAEWDGAADAMLRENEALQAFCRRAAEFAAGGDAPAVLRSLAPSLTDASALPPTPDIKLRTLAARNDALWPAAIAVIELVAANGSDAAWSVTLQAALRPLLRGYVEQRRYRPGA